MDAAIWVQAYDFRMFNIRCWVRFAEWWTRHPYLARLTFSRPAVGRHTRTLCTRTRTLSHEVPGISRRQKAAAHRQVAEREGIRRARRSVPRQRAQSTFGAAQASLKKIEWNTWIPGTLFLNF